MAAASVCLRASDEAMSIAGEWHVLGDGVDSSITLPGTMADAKLGRHFTYDDALKIEDPPAKDALVREWQYKGKAAYSRDITVAPGLADRPLELFLERVMWRSEVSVDGRKLGFRDSLATPHVYQVPPLSAGRHTLSVEVDNSCFYGFSRYAHSYGPEMQSEWHGVLGRMELRLANPLRRCRVFAAWPANGHFEIDACGAKVESVAVDGLHVSGWRETDGRIKVEFRGEPRYWSEFSPKTYTLKIAGGGFSAEMPFGFRTYARNGRTLLVNGTPTFLRGNVDNCNFALTGSPAMTKGEWMRILSVLRDEDGVNMIRFHSWTPPEAAFEAADDLGMYLMPEANMWSDLWMTKGYKEIQSVGHGLPVDGFVQSELDAIVSAYGNHPCFLSLGIGNELGGTKWETAAKWMESLRERDPRRLYFVSTARAITDADDIYLSHKIDGVGPIRCRIFPHTDWDYEDVYSRAPIPTVAHEIGQWPVYPVWDDLLPKFTGVLRPYNIERCFRNAQKTGALRFTSQYHAASAKANRLMYKDEIESFLRTPSCSGVEMLNSQDFTGQGEALVGWRDPFYGLKRGFADEPRFASIWGATNYLARFAKYQWTMAETFHATMHIRNLSQTAISAGAEFATVCAGRRFAMRTPAAIPAGGLGMVGEVTLPIASLEANRKYTLSFGSNSWNFWTYPVEEPAPQPKDVTVTADPAAMKDALRAGKTVLYTGVGAKTGSDTFRPVYWSSSHFKAKRPLDATLGTWFDTSHPAFAGFATDFWADWQWYDLVGGAKIHSLEGAPAELRPIALSVNDFHFSIPSATMFEARVGKGVLFVCGYDLEGRSAAAKRLRATVFAYLGSGRAKPACAIPAEWIDRMYPAAKASAASQSPVTLDVKVKLSGKTFSHVIRDITPVQGVARFHFTGEGSARGNFEGRDFTVPSGKDRWVEVQVMREDALDNEVEVGVTTLSGAPVLDRIQIVREGAAKDLSDCSAAFVDPEFEERGSLGEGGKNVERLANCGLNGSGGIRVHAKYEPQDGVYYRFPSDFKPKAGRKYVFSVCRKVHGKVRAMLAWQCWKGGWCKAHNWNSTLVPLDGGWERQENTVYLKDKDLEAGEFRFMVKVMPAQGSKPEDEAWVDYDCVSIREDSPEWYFANVWPTHDKIFSNKGRIRLHSGFLGPFVPEGHRAKYRLTLAAKDGRKLRVREATPEGGTFTVEFGRLSFSGSAKLKAEIFDASTGAKLGEKTLDVTVAPEYKPKKGEVVITEDGQTLIDGKPFMPLGFYTSLGKSGGDVAHAQRELKKIADAGFNTIMEYWINSYQSDAKIKPFYAACASNSIKVLYNLSGAYKKPDRMDLHVAEARRQLDAGAPLLGWYTLDEAQLSLLPTLRNIRHALNKATPGIPVWQVNIREIEPYLDVADVLGGDHYRIGRHQGNLKQMDEYMALAASCRPATMWYCPQCFNWANYDREAVKDRAKYLAKEKEPTVNEMLSIAFLHAAHGVKGFIFYMYDEIFKGPVPELYEKRWEDVKEVGRVMKGLEPFILSGHKIEDIPTESKRGSIRAVKMTDGKGRSRILVIGLDYDNDASFRLPAGCEKLRPAFGNVTVEDGVCRFKAGKVSCDLLK